MGADEPRLSLEGSERAHPSRRPSAGPAHRQATCKVTKSTKINSHELQGSFPGLSTDLERGSTASFEV